MKNLNELITKEFDEWKSIKGKENKLIKLMYIEELVKLKLYLSKHKNLEAITLRIRILRGGDLIVSLIYIQDCDAFYRWTCNFIGNDNDEDIIYKKDCKTFEDVIIYCMNKGWFDSPSLYLGELLA